MAEFGSYLAPDDFGSGGRDANTGSTRGGGAIKIFADSLTLNGIISANGQATGSYFGAGSGGSIWLDVGTFSGSGSITANGGGVASYGAGGGGGRVAVYYDQVSGFDLAGITAKGGNGRHSGTSGGAGTVYLADTTQNTASLKLESTSKSSELTKVVEDISGLDSLAVSNANIELSHDLSALESLTISSANLEVNHDWTISAITPIVLNDSFVRHTGALEVNGTSLSLTNSTFEISATTPVDKVQDWTTVSLQNNSQLRHGYAGETSVRGLDWTIDSLTVDETSIITANSRGQNYLAGTETRAGGTYGGRGGSYSSSDSAAEFGSYLAPDDFGSGGRDANTGSTRGGGAIKIFADSLTLNGTISANGQATGSYFGAGSGGSIWLDVGTFSGSGSITANGGGVASYGAGGGGGRVAVYYDQVSGFDLAGITATGGNGHSSGASGGAGTVYLVDTTQSLASLKLVSLSKTSELTKVVEDISGLDSLAVSNANIELSHDLSALESLTISSANLEVNHDWTISAITPIVLNDSFVRHTGALEVNGTSLSLTNSTFEISATTPVDKVQDWTTVSLQNNSQLRHGYAGETSVRGLDWTVDSLTVDETSIITANSRGQNYLAGTETRAGGTYGGRGGSYSSNDSAAEFGSYLAPDDFGSGGRDANTGSTRGGGAIKNLCGQLDAKRYDQCKRTSDRVAFWCW